MNAAMDFEQAGELKIGRLGRDNRNTEIGPCEHTVAILKLNHAVGGRARQKAEA